MKPQILVVDDEETARNNFRRYLNLTDFEVITADSGEMALGILRHMLPDLIVTDADMPGINGFALCSRVKRNPQTRLLPIIMISGKALDDESILTGFNEGADDYILKPVSMPVLIARIRSVLRRYEKSADRNKVLKKCGLALNPIRRSARIGEKDIPLTRKEFDLITILLESSERVLSPEFLLETVWGYNLAEYNNPQTVAVHISRLRKKLGPKVSTHIQRIPGLGYRFEA